MDVGGNARLREACITTFRHICACDAPRFPRPSGARKLDKGEIMNADAEEIVQYLRENARGFPPVIFDTIVMLANAIEDKWGHLAPRNKIPTPPSPYEVHQRIMALENKLGSVTHASASYRIDDLTQKMNTLENIIGTQLATVKKDMGDINKRIDLLAVNGIADRFDKMLDPVHERIGILDNHIAAINAHISRLHARLEKVEGAAKPTTDQDIDQLHKRIVIADERIAMWNAQHMKLERRISGVEQIIGETAKQ